MSETLGIPYDPSAKTVHEAYSFACLGCGHGWEQSYEIAHHTDEAGHTTVTYYVGRQPVPSPLTRPRCMNCGGHLVRIMRSGRVSGVGREHLPSSAMSSQGAAAASWADPFNVLGGVGWETGWEREEKKKQKEEPQEERPGPGMPRQGRNWIAVLLALFRRHQD
jgi:hypothetical protein